MAKFSLVFASAGVLLLVAMVAVTEAKTVITTTTFEENPSGRFGTGSECYRQIMQQDMLSQCGMYLMNLEGGSGQIANRPGGEDHKQLCCTQLSNVGQECICPGIKLLMNQLMWIVTGPMMGEMMKVAQKLPTECKLMSQPCQILQAVWF